MATFGLDDQRELVKQLACWRGTVSPEYLTGGRTNVNFVVEDCGEKYVVRVGSDIPEHMIMRFNEIGAARAAERVGISPPIIYCESGVFVMRFIEGITLAEEDIQRREVLARIVPLIKRCHEDIEQELEGPVLAFWVFHVIRQYIRLLSSLNVRYAAHLKRYLNMSNRLETAVGPSAMKFTHNDLLASNFIDDGKRLWLIDWDYAGFGSPMFDLGGLSSNNRLSEENEVWLLETYFEHTITERLWFRFMAMKCASLLRESLWSMVSEVHSELSVDYIGYTETNLARLEECWVRFLALDS